MDPCFNLAREKWIRVQNADGSVEEVTLVKALTNASEYRALAGETPTQNVAVLRFLLAVLYAALFGEKSFETPDDAIEAWFELWDAGKFPEEAIIAYLDKWVDRFWLFHDQRPFFQVPAGKEGITMENAADISGLDKHGKPSASGVQKASKLNGAIFESGNKDNLFNIATGARKFSLSFPEAARWLLHVICFDDGGIKPYYKKNTPMNVNSELASCSEAWVGSTTPIFAEGDSLFETILLNLVLLKDGELDNESIWPRQLPTWEYETLHNKEMVGESLPDNPAELLTFLSRRIMLIRREDKVLGFVRYVGEAFPREAATTDQWTLWSLPSAKKGAESLPVPRTSRLSAQMWREMGALLVVQDNGAPLPGVVRWIRLISSQMMSPLKNSLCRFHYIKARYDVSQKSNMTEILEDSVTFSVGLLTEAGHAWVTLLTHELDMCNDVAQQLGLLAERIFSAEGGKLYEIKNGKRVKTNSAIQQRDLAQEQFFYEINQPFRQWLRSLRAEDDSEMRHNRVEKLRELTRNIAYNCGREMMSKISPTAFSKRNKTEEDAHLTAPQAWVIFKATMKKTIIIDENNVGGV